MTSQNTTLSGTAAAKLAQVAAAAKAPEKAAPAERVFYGELPPAISYLTATAKPVFFYNGYHVTSDPEVIAFCATVPGIADVTDEVDIANVPRPEQRSRQRSWASAEKTTITPGELLARAVRVQSTADLGGNSAASNSSV